MDTEVLVGRGDVDDIDDVNSAAWLVLLVGTGTMDMVGVSSSAVKLPPVGVAVGVSPIVSFVVMSEAVVVGIRGDELVAVLGAASMTPSLDVKDLCVESPGTVLVEEDRGTSEGPMETELTLRMVVDEGFGVSREVEETPVKELDIAKRN